MKKIVLPLIALGLITNLSLGATGHIDGCPNTGYDTSCCTKKYKIEAKPGYKVTDVLVNGKSKGVISEYTFTDITGPQKLEVKTALLTYKITFDLNDGVGEIEEQTKTHGKDLILTSVKPTKEGHTFLGWSTDENATIAMYKAGGTYSVDGDQTLYAVYRVGNIKELTTTPNAPVVVGTGLTPVNWDKEKGEWVDTKVENWVYDYSYASENNGTIEGDGTAMWANARTEDGSMYVWIPRFTYYTDTVNTYILFSDGLDDYTRDPSGETDYWYKPHSAFNVYNGDYHGGDIVADGLEGFWVAKYQGSCSDATDTSIGAASDDIKFVPNKMPYESSYESFSYQNTYKTLLNEDLRKHLIKFSEWGAIVYLTNTIGQSPDFHDTSEVGTGVNWNSVDGILYSTTHNIYGIYDMASKNGEVVALYKDSGSSLKARDCNYTEYWPDSENKDFALDCGVYDWSITSGRINSSYANLLCGRNGIEGKNRIGNNWSKISFRAVISPIEENYSTHTVIYDSNGGEEITDSETLGHLEIHTVIGDEPTREGYIFIGWSTDKDAIYPEYIAGDTFFSKQDTTLYAIWVSLGNEVTNYTQEDIDNSGGMMKAIGDTDDLYVIARKVDDTVIITKNGEESDGIIEDFDSSNTLLTGSQVIIGYGVNNLGMRMFEDCDDIENVVILDGLTTIGEQAFYLCNGLKSITLPESVINIESDAFWNCSGLTGKLVIPGSVTSIGEQAFRGCSSLTEITINASVTSLPARMFQGCTSLKSITIPESVTSIGAYTFFECEALTDIYYDGTTAEWENISCGSKWNSYTGTYTVHCTDGDIAK